MLKWLNKNCVTLFNREKYPVCFEIPVSLIEGEKLPAVIARLRADFSCGIRFVPHDQSVVVEYPIQVSARHELLEVWKTSKVMDGIRFRDGDSDGLFFEMICFNGDLTLNSDRQIEELRRFIKSENSVIKLIIIRLGDSPFWYFFLAQNQVNGFYANYMAAILSAGENVIREVQYRLLHGMTLEEIYKSKLL